MEFATTEEPLHCEVKHGGMVWVTLDPNPTMSVEQWTAGAFDCIESAIDTYEMEVFHYHKVVINTNYKLCMIRTVSSTTILCITLIVYLVLMMNILQEKIFLLRMVM